MPVYSNFDATYAGLRIGSRVRRARKARGWTLGDLAGRFDTSVATLSSIENDKAPLSVERLLALSQTLGIPPHALFASTTTRHFHITRGSTDFASAAPAIVDDAGRFHRAYGNPVRPLAAPFIGKHMGPFEITVLPASDAHLSFITHHQEEFFIVLSGAVECLIDTPEGRVRQRLGPRDSMYFHSHLPHCIRAVGASSARTLHVLCPALGDTEIDRVDGDLGPIFRHTGRNSARLLVAAKIKMLRERSGLSLGAGAKALAVSERRLAAIERGHRPVGLDVLLRVCSVFRKPAEYFLDSLLIGPPYYVVQRARAIPHLRPRRRRQPFLRSRQRSCAFKSLADRFGRRGMYPYYVRVPSEGVATTKMHEHHGQEFVHVLTGEVTLITVVDGARIVETLSRGDSCFIDSTVPHRFIATSSAYHMGDAEVIDVFWCPLGEDYLFVESAGAPAPSTNTTSRRSPRGAVR